jgi:hypothetical protein
MQPKIQGAGGLQNMGQAIANTGSNNLASGSNNFGQGGATQENASLNQQLSFNP